MTFTMLLIAAFAVLLGGLMLPLPYGVRSAIFLALIMLGVLTFIGGGAQYLIGLVQ